jgi:hypothetical protein
MPKTTTLESEIQHAIYTLQHYGEILTAAGADWSGMDALDVFGASGRIGSDPEVSRTFWEAWDNNPPRLPLDDIDREFDLPPMVDSHRLLIQVLKSLPAATKHAVLVRCGLQS